MIRTTLAPALLTSLSLLVTGCGGSGGDDGAPTVDGTTVGASGNVSPPDDRPGSTLSPSDSGTAPDATPSPDLSPGPFPEQRPDVALDPSLDADGDGTSDADERLCRSDAADPESDCANLDGDAQDDAAEMACGSDPRDAASLAPDTDKDGSPDCLGGYPSLPVTGAAGQTVDCAATLPCTWVSADGGIEAHVTFADGYFRLNGLDRGNGHALSTVTTFVVNDRDATVTLLRGAEATSDSGDAFLGRERLIPPGGTGGSASFGAREVAALAGTPFRVRELFDRDVEGTGLLDELVLPFADNDNRLAATFRNVPYGKAPSVERDCEDFLPCVWVSADGVRTFTIDTVRVNLDDQLELGVSYETSAPGESVVMSVENAAFAGNDFEVYRPVRLTLGNARDLRLVSAPTPANERVSGTLTTDLGGRDLITDALVSLNRATVQLYDASETVPFYNPVFRNLPVAR